MMKKIEHIGIAVSDLKEADELFSKLLKRTPYKVEKVEREGVATSFYQIGDSKIELLEATDASSAIAKHISKRGEGMHHIAIEVEDIRQEMERLKKEGFLLINEQPQTGADNKLICFLHPKSTNGVLIELCQEIKTIG